MQMVQVMQTPSPQTQRIKRTNASAHRDVMQTHDEDPHMTSNHHQQTQASASDPDAEPMSQNPAHAREHAHSTHTTEKSWSAGTALDSESWEHEVCS